MKPTHVAAFAATFLISSNTALANLPDPGEKLTMRTEPPTPVEMACNKPGSRIYTKSSYYQSDDGKEVFVVNYTRPDPNSGLILITGGETYLCPNP